jgi:hypothetical protein
VGPVPVGSCGPETRRGQRRGQDPGGVLFHGDPPPASFYQIIMR